MPFQDASSHEQQVGSGGYSAPYYLFKRDKRLTFFPASFFSSARQITIKSLLLLLRKTTTGREMGKWQVQWRHARSRVKGDYAKINISVVESGFFQRFIIFEIGLWLFTVGLRLFLNFCSDVFLIFDNMWMGSCSVVIIVLFRFIRCNVNILNISYDC